MRPILLAFLTLVAALVVGVVLMAAGRVMIGMIAMLAGIPVALTVWIVSNDRA